MRSSEVRATGELVASAVAGTAAFVQDAHAGIASRPFRAVGVLGAPVRLVHDRVAGSAYRLVARALGAGPRAGAALLSRATPVGAPALGDSLRGSMALGALNGAIGDRLAQRGSPLGLAMTFRHRGEEVSPAEYPDPTERLVVFVHGLCETDEAWHVLPFSRSEASRRGYGSRLRGELGYSPLYLRYNSGLHISDNGRRLAELLEQVVSEWPVPVEEIAFVGHSMGGLVARSACHYGAGGGARWTESVRHVFCLGSPHMGAPLERAANAAGHALARLPETRPLAKVVNGRSVGIKDLRFGSCAEDDWCGCDPDEFLRDRCTEVPFLGCATYYFVGATLARDPDGRSASLVGDLLVQYPSSAGQGRGRSRQRRIPFEIDNGCHVGGANHFQLLNHPAVYDQIVAWLGRAQLAAGPAAGSGD